MASLVSAPEFPRRDAPKGSGTPLLPRLDYKLLNQYGRYQPSIELSRGCGMGCTFCVEGAVPLSVMKSPEAVAREIRDVIAAYQDNTVQPYFEASFFRPSTAWSRSLSSLTHSFNT